MNIFEIRLLLQFFANFIFFLTTQVSDSLYEEDMDEDKELLRVEMALAEKELLAYEKTINNKRRRTYIIQN